MTTNTPAVSTTTQPRPRRRRTNTTSKRPTAANAAIIGLIGTLGGALIAAMPSILDKIGPGDGNVPSTPVTEIQGSGHVWVDKVKFSDSGTKVTVSGSAVPRVEAVGVMISPPDAGDPTWSAGTKVSDGKWSVVVSADQKMPSDVEIKAYYKERTASAMPVMKSYVTFQSASTTSTAPPPAPAQVTDCPAQTAEGCFTGPGWGPPSIYRTGS